MKETTYKINTDTGFVGKHVIMDSISTNIFKLTSTETVYRFISDLTKLLDMTLIVPPIVIEFPFSGEAETLAKNLINSGVKSSVIDDFLINVELKNTKKSGVSGIAIWAESHTSFHSWPFDMFFSLDMYSCKDFDPLLAIKFVATTFNVSKSSVAIIDRYTNGPHKICNGEVKNNGDTISIKYPC